MPQHIYFDESGFTGNRLLDAEQRFFVYASVATDDQEARPFVESLIRRYGIQTGELKGSKLIKFQRGRKAIDEILGRFGGQLKVFIADKKFALAGKLHEYIFEPCYSEISSLFYNVGFHLFIANILYLEFAARGAGAEEIFREFEELVRTRDEGKLENLFSSSVHPENSPIITHIREFAQHRVADVRAELASLSGVGASKWILDLTQTALFTLLASWGGEHDEMTAVCDPSKPLQQSQEVFNVMIGRKDRIFSSLGGRRSPITFNLSGPIQFPDSKVTQGIQIADTVATAALYAFSSSREAYVMKWRDIIAPRVECGILPNLEVIKPGALRAQLNAAILYELRSRAKAGESLSEGMPEFVDRLSLHLVSRPELAAPLGLTHE